MAVCSIPIRPMWWYCELGSLDSATSRRVGLFLITVISRKIFLKSRIGGIFLLAALVSITCLMSCVQLR